MDKAKLIGLLARWVAAGKLEARYVIPAIQELSGDDIDPSLSLWSVLETMGGLAEGDVPEPLAALTRHLRETLRQEATRAFQQRRLGNPLPEQTRALLDGLDLEPAMEWKLDGDPIRSVELAVQATRDLAFASRNQAKAPQLFQTILARTLECWAAAAQPLITQTERSSAIFLEQLEQAWPPDCPGREKLFGPLRARRQASWKASSLRATRGLAAPPTAASEPDEQELFNTLVSRFASAAARSEKMQILDGICSWGTPAAAKALRSMTLDTWAQDRALLNLTLRFGHPGLATWADWLRWLAEQERLWQTEEERWSQLSRQPASARGWLVILYSKAAEAEPAVLDALVQAAADTMSPIDVGTFVRSWVKWVPINEQRALLGVAPLEDAAVPPVLPGVAPATARPGSVRPPPLPISAGAAPVRAPKPEEVSTPRQERRPAEPSMWQKHIQPFFVENWYIVAGIAMVILGSSLLAYYTWDKHWLLRYTIMPILLGLFTWSLAGVGGWIERKGSEFKGTAAILRGAAIGLLPINFMTMALLSADQQVSQKGTALLAMALVYLTVFGWGLKTWCAAVEPSLGYRLGGPLLLLNALVAVGPFARTVLGLEGRSLLLSLGTGFYLGFVVMAWAVMRFARGTLTRAMAEERRVPWFVAGALALTYVQVFIWVHGFMRHLPHPHTYALLVIFTGWLVLALERRASELLESPQLHAGESFLGFAMILLGVLMGFGEERLRIVTLVAAGGAWMYQAGARRHPLHYWIALTFWALAVTSVGLLTQFPGQWWPALGIGAALGLGGGGWASQRQGRADLAAACRGMEAVVLLITVVTAPLVQWHYQTAPLGTAGWLLAAALLFGWRALKDQNIHWLHTTLLLLALILPYAGCMDMAGRTAHHNTMAFGLAVLSAGWLGVTRFAGRRLPLLLQARSGALWFYGILAVTAMLLRVALGDAAPDPLWYRDYMDYAGPILMMLILVPATYHSRSLVPAGMAVVIMVILFPELKANLQQSTPWLSWGTGFGSSIWGLGLVGLCFYLRGSARFGALFQGRSAEADLFMGKEPFALRRDDHRLFTWPLMAAALFLLIKVDTWCVARQLVAGAGVPMKTAVALGLTGVAWTLTGIYYRAERGAVVAIHLGWIWMGAGLGFGYWRSVVHPDWTWPVLGTGLLLQALYWFYRFQLERAWPWVRSLLTEPTRLVLQLGSAALVIVCVIGLLWGVPLVQARWLYGFLAVQMIWHALHSREAAFGAILFFQVWVGLLVATAPGAGALWDRLSVARSASPTLWLLAGVQLCVLALELVWVRRDDTRTGDGEGVQASGHSRGDDVRELESLGLLTPHPGPLPVEAVEGRGSRMSRGQAGTSLLAPAAMGWMALLRPMLIIASCLTFLAGLAGIAEGVQGLGWSRSQDFLLLGTLLLTARAHRSNFLLLIAMLTGYVSIYRGLLAAVGDPLARLYLLANPWPLALFSLGMVALTQAGRWLHQRKPRWLAGTFNEEFLTAPSCGWIFYPAALLCGLAAFQQTADPIWRERAAQLSAPFLGALTLAAIGWFWRRAWFFGGAGLLLLLGDVHLVRVWGGDFLRVRGLSELHLICLGMGLALVQVSLMRRWIRPAQGVAAVNLASLGLAGVILALLSANYFTDPNLAGITSWRFVVSGGLAWMAGRYFRRASRQPAAGEEAYVGLCEGVYHFGLVLAIWCGALLVPWFRQPIFALVALGLPVVYFYGRAEFAAGRELPAARRYQQSAAVLGFVMLGLYLCRGIFQMVLFPGVPISTEHYHYNAPVILLLGVVLLRLHALGGTSWLAFYGGLAVMLASYFLLTFLPGLSPFSYPMPGAWCALGLGHFWILLGHARSPLRTFLQRLAGLDDAAWRSSARAWSLCLLAATHGTIAWGMVDYSSNTFMVAPLLAGAASFLIHLAILQRSTIYVLVAALELVSALHADFLIPSVLPRGQIIWALLGIWLALLIVAQLASGKISLPNVSRVACGCAVLVMAHVLYHRPWSEVGLWAVGLGALLAWWNPQATRAAATTGQTMSAAALVGVPVWLVYFSQSRFAFDGLEAAWQAWPVLAATATLFLVGLVARYFPEHWAAGYRAWPRSTFRLFDASLMWLETTGLRLHRVILWFGLGVVGITQGCHYPTAFVPREFTLLLLLELALTVAWWNEAKRRPVMVSYYCLQLAAVVSWVTIRRQLLLTGWWNYEYDVWVSLAGSCGLAGARQVLDLRLPARRVPYLTLLILLPMVAMAWVMVRGLGVNLALLVVGLHSVIFVYLGRNERESPYNVAALAGFVGFILISFYSKLHLRAVHAYIIPVGLGVLILQELFRTRIRAETRNGIRLVTLMGMLGSAGYYALADERHAVTFNLTMLLLCLFAMGLGSVLRIRLYLALGLAGLLVDLVSLLWKALVLMERGVRMTVIGSLVLGLGAILVFGAIYYKTHKARFEAWHSKWRLKLGQWE